ncbi:MAG TPA: DsrE family protein [Nitriliruptorales bacterium]
MVKRVLSLLRGADPGSARQRDPALDLNAYAVAEDVELTLVLKDRGVELALVDAHAHPTAIAGHDVPCATPAADVRALLASGVRVLAVDDDLSDRGLAATDLVDGVEIIAGSQVARLLIEHDVTLTSSTG